MDVTRVALLDDYQDVARTSADWAREPRIAVTTFRDTLTDQDALVDRLGPFPVVVAMRERTPFPESLLRRLPGLRLIVTTGMKNASIDLDVAARLGVTVSGTGSSVVSTVELTWGLLLGVTRGLAAADADVRAGRWQTSVGMQLSGRTLGIVGLGRIGAQMARIAAAFDLQVLAWSRNLTAADAGEHGATRVERDELFERSDVVTVHVPLNDSSRGLVGARQLELLGPHGYLVNTSRGPLVDTGALVAALTGGAIAGAALDVYDTEPLPADDPLLGAPNLLLSPHLGYVSSDNYRVMYGEALEDVTAWLDRDPLRVLTP